jgi:glycosyltransferase involved in cell wall biosynthesis
LPRTSRDVIDDGAMKILFLAHNFPPEANALASRTYEHAKLWVKMGHRVEVVTCAPNHPKGKLYSGYRNALIQREQMDGVDVVRLWTFLAANEGVVLRSLNYLSFLLSATAQSWRLERPDIVVSSSPQLFTGLAGYVVSRLKGVPWVLEIRDLWPESIVAVGALKRGSLVRGLEALEGFAYRKADHLVSVTTSFVEHFAELGIAADRVSVITNGADLELFARAQANPALAEEIEVAGKFVAAYIGTHGMAHALDTVLDAANRLRERDDIRFLFVGSGAQQARLRERSVAMGLSNVIMLDQQPRHRMPAIWGLANASIVHLRKTPLFRTVIPSKIFEAMAAGVPTLLGVEGEAAEIVTKAEAGLVFEPENARELADAVKRLADDPDLAARLGANGRRAAVERYDRRVLAAKYLALLERVAGRERGGAT